MSSPSVTRRIHGPGVPGRPRVVRTPDRSRAGASLAEPPARKARRAQPRTAASRFVIVLMRRNAVTGRPREKRYLARRAGRTYFVTDAAEAMIYPSYKTAYMIGIKAAIHYGGVACIEEFQVSSTHVFGRAGAQS
ncbi:hypothetical protein SVA_1775 [Sulfurifustis variabilis]|uniref:Uncharacterized protein n=2 Tax=Sulfurifustis variabilis TaxID=1675686 RepID=A0A1B4V488_9GAMM|nr:hypothetical protein SVA_1775 [Sulfurifustis variabilis]